MNTVIRRSSVQLLAIAAVLVCGVSVFEVTGARTLLAPPTSVATIELNRVLAGLNQRTSAEADLQVRRDRIRTEGESRKKNIDDLRTRLEAATGPERESLQEDIVLGELGNDGWLQFELAQLDIEKALLMENLYRQIKVATEELARAQGYDLVLINDADEPFAFSNQSKMPRESQLRNQIASRRVLFANNTVDISDDLVQRMNNSFNARQ